MRIVLPISLTPLTSYPNKLWPLPPSSPASSDSSHDSNHKPSSPSPQTESTSNHTIISQTDHNNLKPHHPTPKQASQAQLDQLLAHISLKWSSLVRSNLSILDLLKDPKWPSSPGEPYRLYVNTSTGDDNLQEITQALTRSNPLGDLDQVQVLELPSWEKLFHDRKHGALYLPYPYVVPGGVFQEMYAWDSFFIALGLIRDKEIRLARNVLDNQIYQIEHYGKILNGNRTYYLNRSQLPFLTPLIKLIYPTVSPSQAQAWLRQAIKAAEKYHTYWTTGDHLVKETGLSRFFDASPPGSSPPEIIHETDPRDGATAHERVKHYFKQHYEAGIPDYDIRDYYNPETDKLTAKYMDNDRAMRESGFDTSARFGPFNAKILDFNPICLNTLLAQMEAELGELYGLLQPSSVTQAKKLERQGARWKARASQRAHLIRRYNWDEEDGLFYDYDFVRGERRRYVFGTTFLPLWTGLASETEAARVVLRGLKALEVPGGLATSDEERGDQWDKPYAWAPLQMFGVEGMRRYGFEEEADRVGCKFGSMVLKTWLATGEIWEKYDAVRRDEHVDLKFGYPTNEIGFGWTNAVFTRIYDQLSPKARQKLLELEPKADHHEEEETKKEEDEINLPSLWIEGIAKLSIHQKAQLMKLLMDLNRSQSPIGSDEDWVNVVKEEDH